MTDTPDRIAETEAMRVLFLCTHNSSRSQMAEGLLRARGRDTLPGVQRGDTSTHGTSAGDQGYGRAGY